MAERSSRGIAWAGAVNLVGGATGSVVGLLLAAVVGRHLGTEGAGTYFVVVAVVTIVSHVAELGADTGLVRFVSGARATGRSEDVPVLLAIALRPVVLTGLAVVAAAAAWALLTSSAPAGLTDAFVVVGATAAVLSSMTAVMLAAVRGLGDVVTYPLVQSVLLPVLRLAGVLGVATVGGGVVAVLGAWLAPVPVVLAVACAVALTMTVRGSSSRTSERDPTATSPERRALARGFWTFSAARGAAATVEILLEWVDVLIVGALASAEAAGVYAVVTRCARAGEVVQQAARVAVGPRIGAALARGATAEVREVYGLVTAAMIWLAWPMFIVLAVFSDTVLRMFGEGFDGGALPLTVLSIAMGLATAAGTVQTIVLMGGRSSWQLKDKAAALVVNVALNLLLVPAWGIDGAAVAWAVTILLDTALVVYQVQRLMGLRPAGRQLGVAAALSLGIVGTTTLTARLVLGASTSTMLAATGVAAVLYLGTSLALRDRLGLVDLVRYRTGG